MHEHWTLLQLRLFETLVAPRLLRRGVPGHIHHRRKETQVMKHVLLAALLAAFSVSSA